MHNAQKYFKMDPTCRLCYKEEETISHILLHCPALHKPRARFLPVIASHLMQYNIQPSLSNLLQAILDISTLPVPPASRHDIELAAHSLCYSVHCSRAHYLALAGHQFKRPKRAPPPRKCNKSRSTVAAAQKPNNQQEDTTPRSCQAQRDYLHPGYSSHYIGAHFRMQTDR